jgi:hypothetical protein
MYAIFGQASNRAQIPATPTAVMTLNTCPGCRINAVKAADPITTSADWGLSPLPANQPAKIPTISDCQIFDSRRVAITKNRQVHGKKAKIQPIGDSNQATKYAFPAAATPPSIAAR